ncbi:MAG: peptide chain release factor 1 [Nitrospiraceae bacterium]|nr:peptide chain release factor 1 [Nitrospiraceae bacterium]
MKLIENLESIEKHYEDITNELSKPEVIQNRDLYQKLAREQSELYPLIGEIIKYKKLLAGIEEAEELIGSSDEELRKLALDELDRLRRERPEFEKNLILMLIPKDRRDEKNVIVEIRAGTGGEEAALFASELFRMYSKYAEVKRWKVEVIDSNVTGLGGIKEIVASIQGKGVFSRLKFESGVHRVQRVPSTETSGRVHTSAATVAVLPEAEDVDLKIEEKDLRIDTFCAGGHGGQSVNTTYSAVRIVHEPTGVVVQCQDERSQLKNREKAMKVLRARIYEIEQEKLDQERARDRKSQVGTGDRSQRIRTYNYPQNRVTDHRIGLTLYKLDQFLEGALDEMIEGLVAYFQTEKLKEISALEEATDGSGA